MPELYISTGVSDQPLLTDGDFELVRGDGGALPPDRCFFSWALIGCLNRKPDALAISAPSEEREMEFDTEHRTLTVSITPTQEDGNGALCAVVFMRNHLSKTKHVLGFLPVLGDTKTRKDFDRLTPTLRRTYELQSDPYRVDFRRSNLTGFDYSKSVPHAQRKIGGVLTDYDFGPSYVPHIGSMEEVDVDLLKASPRLVKIVDDPTIHSLLGQALGPGIRLLDFEPIKVSDKVYPITATIVE